MATTPLKPITARRKLELSQLSSVAVQQEAMGKDVDFSKFVVYLNGKVEIDDLSDRIVSATILRTIEGASTLTVVVNDYDRKLLRSDALHDKLDVQIDGLWFRYTGNDKSGDEITLTFEDREIAILRTYHSWKIANRTQMTRAEFVLRMIQEVKEFRIPYNIPELAQVQPIAKYDGDTVGVDQITSKARGIPISYNQDAKSSFNHREPNTTPQGGLLTVKGSEATQDQIRNCNTILAVADSLGCSRKQKVISIMVAIQESTLNNLPGGDRDSIGLFQQRGNWGSVAERSDPETAARLFFNGTSSGISGLIQVDKDLGDVPYWVTAANVQHPAKQYESLYAKWRTEAERFVNAQGDTGSSVTAANNMNEQLLAFSSASGAFYFWRGNVATKNGVKIRKPENTWSCTQRLGDEVDWRSFFVSGTFNFISEKLLFQQLPLATITEFTEGIDSIDGQYDRAKKSATLTVKARVGRWLVPPGSVVVVTGMGHYDGRWLVIDFERDLVGEDRTATITLKKPRPKLPEPAGANDTNLNASWAPGGKTAGSVAVPTTNATPSLVLQNKQIHFSNSLETTDITLGSIDERIMQILLWLTSNGYTITVTALKSDHSKLTSEGRPSAHGDGRAVDIGAVDGVAITESNPNTSVIMKLLAANQPGLGFDQLIGPYPLLCIPRGLYDAKTLGEHKNHIHIGVAGAFQAGNG